MIIDENIKEVYGDGSGIPIYPILDTDKVSIGTDKIFNVTVHSSSGDSNITIGEIYSSYITAEIYGTNYELEDEEIQFSVTTPGEDFSDIPNVPMGTYVCEKAEKSKTTTNITCYDKLKYVVDTYDNKLANDCTYYQLLTDIGDKYGFEVAYSELLDVPAGKYSDYDGWQDADIIKNVAGYLGANAFMNEFGELCFRRYEAVEFATDDDKYAEFTEGQIAKYGVLTCKGKNETQSILIGDGEGNEIKFNCDNMSSTRLIEIANYIDSLNYKATNVHLILGSPLIQVCDIITVDGVSVPIMSLTTKVTGGCNCDIRANYTSTAEESNTQTITDKIDDVVESVGEVETSQNKFSQAFNGALGLYTTKVETTSGVKTYYHNADTLEKSNYIFTTNANGFAYTKEWKGDETVWEGGLDKDGNAIVNYLIANKITADILETGKIQSVNQDVSAGDTFEIDLDNAKITSIGQGGKSKMTLDEGALKWFSNPTDERIPAVSQKVQDDGVYEIMSLLAVRLQSLFGIELFTSNVYFSTDSIVIRKIDAARTPVMQLSVDDLVWQDIELNSDFTARDDRGGNTKPQYRLVGDMLQLSGGVSFVTNGATSSAGTITTLPEGYRPKASIIWLAACQGGRMARLSMTTAGNIILDYVLNLRTGEYDSGSSVWIDIAHSIPIVNEVVTEEEVTTDATR